MFRWTMHGSGAGIVDSGDELSLCGTALSFSLFDTRMFRQTGRSGGLMTELVLRRAGNLYQDRARLYRVILDGREITRIATGEEKRISVQPGRHALQLKIDWCGCKPLALSVQAGEVQAFSCGPNGSAAGAFLRVMFLWNRYLYLRHEATGTQFNPAHAAANTVVAASAAMASPPGHRPATAHYRGVLMALLRALAIVGTAGWLVFLIKQNLVNRGPHLPQFAFVVIVGGMLGGAGGYAFSILRRALLKIYGGQRPSS